MYGTVSNRHAFWTYGTGAWGSQTAISLAGTLPVVTALNGFTIDASGNRYLLGGTSGSNRLYLFQAPVANPTIFSRSLAAPSGVFWNIQNLAYDGYRGR